MKTQITNSAISPLKKEESLSPATFSAEAKIQTLREIRIRTDLIRQYSRQQEAAKN